MFSLHAFKNIFQSFTLQTNKIQDLDDDLSLLSNLVTSENVQIKSGLLSINATVLQHGIDIANLQTSKQAQDLANENNNQALANYGETIRQFSTAQVVCIHYALDLSLRNVKT